MENVMVSNKFRKSAWECQTRGSNTIWAHWGGHAITDLSCHGRWLKTSSYWLWFGSDGGVSLKAYSCSYYKS